MDGDLIKDVSFQGSGCAISKASASMMTAAVKGKTKEEAEVMFDESTGWSKATSTLKRNRTIWAA